MKTPRMKIAVLYCSKHGTTEKVARLISQKKGSDEVHLFNLLQVKDPDIRSFEEVIIGGSVHYGQIQKQIKVFCEKNKDLLIKRNVGLFICCMLKEKCEEQFEAAFPQYLKDHCRVKGYFGGELLFDKMNFLEKLIVKKVTSVKQTKSDIDLTAIDQFINGLENVPTPISVK